MTDNERYARMALQMIVGAGYMVTWETNAQRDGKARSRMTATDDGGDT